MAEMRYKLYGLVRKHQRLGLMTRNCPLRKALGRNENTKWALEIMLRPGIA